MIVFNVGQWAGPIVLHPVEADGTTPGTVDGEPTFAFDVPGIVELQDFPSGKWAHAVAAGQAVLDIEEDAAAGAAVRMIGAKITYTVNDPTADEARSLNVDEGTVQDNAPDA